MTRRYNTKRRRRQMQYRDLGKKTCQYCGALFARKFFSCGQLEPEGKFRDRKTCSPECASKLRGQSARIRNPKKVDWDHPALELKPNWRIKRGDYFIEKTSSVWHPSGPRGPRLTQRIRQRIRKQVAWVKEQKYLWQRCIALAGDVDGITTEIELAIAELRPSARDSDAFSYGQLFLGTVNQVNRDALFVRSNL